MVTGQPAGETIELIGDGQLTALHYPRMQQAAANHPTLLKLSLRLVEWSYLRLEQRLVALQGTSATERLRDLVDREPHVLERVPHYQIASYSGITPETLSRTKTRVFQ